MSEAGAQVALRQATLADVDELVDLLGQLFEMESDFEVDPAKQAAGLRLLIESGRGCVLVAEYDRRVIAMCSVQIYISTAEGGEVGLLEDMVVSREITGCGIGRRLLSAMEAWAAQKGLTRLQLLADRHNAPALAFYDRMGWSRTQLICLRKSLAV
jgi:GNAT superfamily N-acetyltransferase